MILRIGEAGLIDDWQKIFSDSLRQLPAVKYYSDSLNREYKKKLFQEKHKPLNFEHLYGAFFVLSIGAISAFCVLTIEVLYNKLCCKKNVYPQQQRRFVHRLQLKEKRKKYLFGNNLNYNKIA